MSERDFLELAILMNYVKVSLPRLINAEKSLDYNELFYLTADLRHELQLDDDIVSEVVRLLKEELRGLGYDVDG